MVLQEHIFRMSCCKYTGFGINMETVKKKLNFMKSENFVKIFGIFHTAELRSKITMLALFYTIDHLILKL